MRNYTRRFTIPANTNQFDPRYIQPFTDWYVMYELNGEVVLAEIKCRPDQSPKDYLANLGVDVTEAIVEPVV